MVILSIYLRIQYANTIKLVLQSTILASESCLSCTTCLWITVSIVRQLRPQPDNYNIPCVSCLSSCLRGTVEQALQEFVYLLTSGNRINLLSRCARDLIKKGDEMALAPGIIFKHRSGHVMICEHSWEVHESTTHVTKSLEVVVSRNDIREDVVLWAEG
jgi:hypothetical protein